MCQWPRFARRRGTHFPAGVTGLDREPLARIFSSFEGVFWVPDQTCGLSGMRAVGVGRAFDDGQARRLCAQIQVKRHAGREARGPHLQTLQGWIASLWLAFLRVLKGFSGFRIKPAVCPEMRAVGVERVFDSGKARRLCAQIHVKRHAGLEARGPHLQTFQGWTASLWLAFLRALKGFSGFRIKPAVSPE
jgi:hypothetical protein